MYRRVTTCNKIKIKKQTSELHVLFKNENEIESQTKTSLKKVLSFFRDFLHF